MIIYRVGGVGVVIGFCGRQVLSVFLEAIDVALCISPGRFSKSWEH